MRPALQSTERLHSRAGDAPPDRTFLSLLCTGYYLLTLVAGAATVASEWRRIPASRIKKLIYLRVYPLFLLTYLPISLAALFRNVEWTPIRHTPTAEMHHMESY